LRGRSNEVRIKAGGWTAEDQEFTTENTEFAEVEAEAEGFGLFFL
jgi:hypothetical protein